ncbi:MAG TPA: substrate-binding domain-containing protein [Limnochordia bacterium]|jgi:ABC-type sugar transport system substrate-binding protein|nr:substrate-binding domain-containing protein [Limnochordia bacterium]
MRKVGKLLVMIALFSLVFGSVAFAQKKEGEWVIAYIAKNTVDAFHATLNGAATRELNNLKAQGKIANWFLLDGLTDPITQNNLLEDAINMGADIVIMLPAEAAGCAPMLVRAQEVGLPVIVVNSKTDNTDELATAYVGSDDVQAGEMMAQFILEQIPQGGGYAHLMGIIGNSAQIERGIGIHNIMDNQPNWVMLDEQSAEWQAEKAVRFAEDWLTKFGDRLNAIICDNDDMSSAVQAAMNAAGRSDIVCIGVDGNIGPLTMVKNGELRATVYQDGAGQVLKAIELAMKVLNGEEVPKETMIDFVLVTQENVDEYLNR